jgi:hypothetical protein
MKELVFEIVGLSEKELAAYQTGVLDCLAALGIDWIYDETNEDASTFRVELSVGTYQVKVEE